MENKFLIDLNSNKYIKITNEIRISDCITEQELIKKNSFSIKKMLDERKKFLLYLNIENIDDIATITKKIVRSYNYCIKKSFEIGDFDGNNNIIAYIYYPSYEKNLKKYELIKEFLYVLSMENEKEKLEYIYDKTCEELDDIFAKNNYCDFRNDSCKQQRECKSKHSTDGCCYSFYYSKFDGFPVSTGKCKYHSKDKCLTKCISCKMFTCRYLRKKGIKFTCSDFPLLDIFLNKKQKEYAINSFFKTKDEIMDCWIKSNK